MLQSDPELFPCLRPQGGEHLQEEYRDHQRVAGDAQICTPGEKIVSSLEVALFSVKQPRDILRATGQRLRIACHEHSTVECHEHSTVESVASVYSWQTMYKRTKVSALRTSGLADGSMPALSNSDAARSAGKPFTVRSTRTICFRRKLNTD